MVSALEVGQLFVLGFEGVKAGDDYGLLQAIEEDGLGGIILFDRRLGEGKANIHSPEQVACLVSDLQARAEIPLLIGVDQEGGAVCRFKQEAGFVALPSAAELVELGLEQGRLLIEKMAASLSEMGVNLNFAPVVDLNVNGDCPIIGKYGRSYGAVSSDVVSWASLFVDSHRRFGVGCCLKHFPGHGSATGDSHLGFVDITDSWLERELEPFSLLIKKGFADMIMTAHVVNRHLDNGGLPATLSSVIIKHLLRRELGFGGVVVSDDLQMKAIADHWGMPMAIKMAFLAGVDLLVVGNNLACDGNVIPIAVEVVEEMLVRGEISEMEIQQKIDRVKSFKGVYCA